MTSIAKERLDVHTTPDRLQAALHRQRFDFVLEHVPKGSIGLEIGTGVGGFSQTFAAHCRAYTGVEYDWPSCVATAERFGSAPRIIRGDARQLPLKPGLFNAVICLEVLEHTGDFRAGVRNIRRCMSPDGVAVISVPYRRIGGANPHNVYHVYEPGEGELVASLRENFQDVNVYYQFFEENSAMKLARVLHLRRFTGLDRPYRELSEGAPEAVSRLRIEPRSRGLNLHLVVVARKPR